MLHCNHSEMFTFQSAVSNRSKQQNRAQEIINLKISNHSQVILYYQIIQMQNLKDWKQKNNKCPTSSRLSKIKSLLGSFKNDYSWPEYGKNAESLHREFVDWITSQDTCPNCKKQLKDYDELLTHLTLGIKKRIQSMNKQWMIDLVEILAKQLKLFEHQFQCKEKQNQEQPTKKGLQSSIE